MSFQETAWTFDRLKQLADRIEQHRVILEAPALQLEDSAQELLNEVRTFVISRHFMSLFPAKC